MCVVLRPIWALEPRVVDDRAECYSSDHRQIGQHLARVPFLWVAFPVPRRLTSVLMRVSVSVCTVRVGEHHHLVRRRRRKGPAGRGAMGRRKQGKGVVRGLAANALKWLYV